MQSDYHVFIIFYAGFDPLSKEYLKMFEELTRLIKPNVNAVFAKLDITDNDVSFIWKAICCKV